MAQALALTILKLRFGLSCRSETIRDLKFEVSMANHDKREKQS